MPDIDDLSISIESDTSDAGKGLKKLRQTLIELKSVYDSVSGVSGDVSGKLKDLANGVKAISEIEASKLSEATNGLKQFSRIDFSAIASNVGKFDANAAFSMHNLASAIRVFTEIPTETGGAIKAIRNIANANIQGLVNNLNSVSASLSDRAYELAQAMNVFGASVDATAIKQSVSAMKKLSEFDFSGLSHNVNNLDPSAGEKVRKFMEGFDSVSQSFAVADTLQQMQALFQIDFSPFLSFAKQATEYMPGLTTALGQLASVCNTPEFTKTAENLSRLANVDLSGLARLSETKVVPPNVSAAVDKENKETKDAISRMASVFTNGFSSFGKIAVGAAEFGISVLRKGFSNLRGRIERASKSATKFARSIGRIALYRSIRFLLSQITKGFKEGTDNLYQYSKAINGRFAKSLDMISTSLLYFRNSVAAAAAPIINRLAPAIDVLVDRIVEAINYVNQLTAKLTGATTWTKALKYPKEYAEATRDASKSLKDFTMGFDELNIISDTDASSASANLDYSSMFTEMHLDKNFAPWVDELKSAIENSDFYGAGAILGQKFNEMVEKIPFREYGKKLGTGINNAVDLANGFLDRANFENLGSGVAELLNSAMDTINFYNIGYLIANIINNIVDFLYGFVKDFHWDEFGKSLADGFNGFIDKIDLDKLAETLHMALNGLLVAAIEFLKGTEWKELGHKIGDAFNKIDIAETLTNLGKVLRAALKGIFNLLSGVIQGIEWQKLGSDVVNGIFGFLFGGDEKKYTDLAESTMELIGSILGGALAFLWGAFKETAEKSFNFGEKLYDWLHDENGEFSWDNVFTGIEDAGTWIKEHLFTPFTNGFKAAFGDTTEIEDTGENIITSFKEGITNALTNIGEFIRRIVCVPFPTHIDRFFKIAAGGTSGLFSEKGRALIDGLYKGIINALPKIWETGKRAKARVDTFLQNTFFNFTRIIGAGILTAFNKAKSIMGNVFESLKWLSTASLGDIIDAVKGKAVEIGDAIAWIFNDASGRISDFLMEFDAPIKTAVNTMIDAIEFLVNELIFAVNNISSVLNNTFDFEMPDWIPGIGGMSFELNLPQWSEISIPRFANGGYPDPGELFYANENGVPEMIGRVGNRAAVANNDQIVNAVAQGVANVLSEYIPQIIAAIEEGKTPVINIDGKKVTKAIESVQRERGKTIYSGGVVNGI